MEDAAVAYNPEDPGPESSVAQVQRKNTSLLMSIDGVEGVGIGRDGLGMDAIIVYLRDSAARAQVPKQLDGFPVVTQVTGTIEAQGR